MKQIWKVFLTLNSLALVISACKTIRTPGDRDVPYSTKATTTPFAFDPSDKSCGGFPRLRIETKSGYCVGLIKQLNDPSFQPRVILEIPGKPGEFLVSDFAGWSTSNGKIWYLKPGSDASKVQLVPIITGLSVVHQLVAGPGGFIYFSEDSRIRAFPISAIAGPKPITRELIKTALEGLPPMERNGTKNSMHPIKHFVFDRSSNLIVNIGAYTDHCSAFAGKNCEEADLSFGAGSSNFLNHGAVLRLYPFKGTLDKESLVKSWDSRYRIIAQGLRNSMGLLFTPSGDLLQVENSRDFNESFRPNEELNLIPKEAIDGTVAAMHYGWPYCYDYNSVSDEWKSGPFQCDPLKNTLYSPPFQFLPPHSAPLGILAYKGNMFPDLKDKLVISLHGYRSPGHRLVALSTSGGMPIKPPGRGFYLDDDLGGGTESIRRSFADTPSSGEFDYLIHGWYEAPKFRPKGAPVGIAEGSDGSIFMADDKSASILRLAKPSPGFVPLPAPEVPNLSKAYSDIIKESPGLNSSYQAFVSKVVNSPQCQGCHDSYTNPNDKINDEFKHLRYVLSLGTWVVPGNPEKSTLFTKLNPPLKSAMPPIDQPYASLEEATTALETVKKFVMAFPTPDRIWQVKSDGAIIKGLKKGTPGNGICGQAKVGHHVFAISNTPSQLGGKKVLEILVGRPSALVTSKDCDAFDTFFMEQDSLKKL